MGQIGGAMTIKKSRWFGDGDGVWSVGVSTLVRKGEVTLTVEEWGQEQFGPDGMLGEYKMLTRKRITILVGPEVMNLLRRGTDEVALEAIFRRLPWQHGGKTMRTGVRAVVQAEIPGVWADFEKRMEATRRRGLEVAAARHTLAARAAATVRKIAEMVTGPYVPRGIDLSEV